jgi:hypothetical protein
VTGAVTTNTLTATPNPSVKEIVKPNGSNLYARVQVKSARNFKISGYVTGSAGRVQTTVSQHIFFSSQQTFTITNALYEQDIVQSTNINSTVTTGTASGQTTVQDELN